MREAVEKRRFPEEVARPEKREPLRLRSGAAEDLHGARFDDEHLLPDLALRDHGGAGFVGCWPCLHIVHTKCTAGRDFLL